jgi:iron complex outermembrane recepter protein
MNYVLSLLIALYSLGMCAQNPQGYDRNKLPKIGVVNGYIRSAREPKPIDGAAVYLVWIRDSSITASVATDSTGAFKMSNLPAGRYYLKATAVGEGSYRSEPFMLSPQGWEHGMGSISLSNGDKLLKEVDVVAEKAFMTQQGDKKVFNVENNALAAGGSATDILQRIPLISIDLDGNIKMRGSTDVTVWIDGKPALNAANLTQALQQIPANIISKVEILTNPSAKYDAEGTGGIINIVTKRPPDKNRLSGSLGVNWLVYNKAGVNAMLNVKRGKWNFNLSYSYQYNPRTRLGASNRYTTFADTIHTTQTNRGESIDQNHAAKISIDYTASPRDRLSLTTSVLPSTSPETDTNRTMVVRSLADTIQSYTRYTAETNRNLNYFGTLGWKHLFAKDEHSLSVDLFMSSDSRSNTRTYRNQYIIDRSLYYPDQQSSVDGYGRSINLSVDYANPLTKTEKIELGLKSTNNWTYGNNQISHYDTATSIWLPDTLTATYHYNLYVVAGYFTFAQTIKRLNYNVGLRAEQTMIRGDVVSTGATIQQQYFNLFPSGFINYDLPKNQQLHLGYSLRIRRPWAMQLLPINNIDDPQNIRRGNINLQPEIIHSLEASYAVTLAGQFVSLGTYYKHILNPISFFKSFPFGNDQVSLNSFVNGDYNRALGFEFVMRNNLFKRWDITTSLNVGNYSLSSQQGKVLVQNSGWQQTFKAMSNVKFWKQTYFQVGFNYESPSVTLQGRFHGFISLDAGLRKEFLDGKLSLTLSANDIFNNRRFFGSASSASFTQDFFRKKETRTFTMAVLWRFGSNSDPSARKRGRSGTPNFIQDNGGGEF